MIAMIASITSITIITVMIISISSIISSIITAEAGVTQLYDGHAGPVTAVDLRPRHARLNNSPNVLIVTQTIILIMS